VEDLFVTEFALGQIISDGVEAIATRLDEYFCHLYSEMLEAVDCELVQEVFENLRLHMVEEKKRLSIDIYSVIDM
jgi:hypothetical protein